jgi:diaminopimelate decarboxylase
MVTTLNEKYFSKNENGILTIGGVDSEFLKEKFGTPLYVFSKDYILDISSAYRDALESEYGNGMISYASKAFSCKEIYRIMHEQSLGTDVVSGGELYTALSVNFPSQNIIFHGNNKLKSELEYAISSKVGYIVIDALSEINDIDKIAKKYGVIQNVLIRVNPGVEAHTHHYIQTAKVDSKFGFSISNNDAKNAVDKALNCKNIKLKGLHCHIGSQIFDIKSFILALDKMTDFYKTCKDELSYEFDTLNLGGGFGIFYHGDDKVLTPNDYYNFVKIICENLKILIKAKGLDKPFLILEPGRSIVGEAGITLYTAGRIRNITGIKNYIAIDGGMFENPRFALYQAKYTVIAPTKLNEKPTEKYTIAGKCCESGDIIAEDCYLPKINEGDLLAVLSTGAYNYSMASNYNRNLIPPVVLISNKTAKYIVKPSSFEDITRNDV